MSNDTVSAPAYIEILPCNDREVSSTSSIIDITTCENTVIPVRKKEYGIVGDSFFTTINDGPTPPWLDAILDDVIDSILGEHLSGLTDANKNLLDAIFALDVAHNDYKEMIHIDVRVDQAISARLTTLNSRLDSNDATIINLDMNKVTPEMAAAIAIEALSASLNDGAIAGRLASIDYSVSTLAGNVTGTKDLLESRFGELNEAVSELTVEVGAAEDRVYSTFLYDSVLKIGDQRFKSGFGLNAEGKIPVPGQPGVFTSEFWIDAQRLKFTNSNQSGSVSPFTIDASGIEPQVSFNGVVSFSNVTGPDKPEAGATKNEFRGAWTTGTVYRKGDVVTTGGNSWSAKLDHTATSGNKPPALSSNLSSTWLLNAAKGNSVTTVNIYRRSATALSDSHKPTGTSTYNFEANTITGLNNSWTFSIPSGTDPLYVAVASVAAEGTTPTGTIKGSQWSTPVKYVENGLNTATVFVFKRTASNTVPTKPGGTSTYSFKTQSLTTSPTNDWSEGLPSTGGSYRWMSKATAASTGDTDSITATEWSTPRLLAEDGIQGAKGNTGADGADGADGASSMVIYRNVVAKPAKPSNSSSVPSNWSTLVNSSWTGNVWMSRGIKNVGASTFTWGGVELDFSSWRAPNKTTIDGAYIETGTITAAQIKAKSITANEIDTDKLTVKAANITGTLDYNKIRTNGNLLTERINNVKTITAKYNRTGSFSYVPGDLTEFASFGNADFGVPTDKETLEYPIGNFGETGRVVISGTISNFTSIGEIKIDRAKLFFSIVGSVAAIIKDSSGNDVDGGLIYRESRRFKAVTAGSPVLYTSDSILATEVFTPSIDRMRIGTANTLKEIPFSITLECPNLTSGTVLIERHCFYYATVEKLGTHSMVFNIEATDGYSMLAEMNIRNLSVIAHRV